MPKDAFGIVKGCIRDVTETRPIIYRRKKRGRKSGSRASQIDDSDEDDMRLPSDNGHLDKFKSSLRSVGDQVNQTKYIHTTKSLHMERCT